LNLASACSLRAKGGAIWLELFFDPKAKKTNGKRKHKRKANFNEQVVKNHGLSLNFQKI
jgi:hypothetical protein